MTEYDNLVVYMADSVRRDFFPEFDKGVTVDAVAQGPNTPTSFPAILSGELPNRHGVNWFEHQVQVPTVLDLDQKGFDVGLFDHPDDPIFSVFRNPPRKDFDEIESEPFVWVEREVVTHIPYNEKWSDYGLDETSQDKERVYPGHRGRDYIDLMRLKASMGEHGWSVDRAVANAGNIIQNRDELTEWQESTFRDDFDYIEDYRDSIRRSKERFHKIVSHFEEKGMADNTLFVYCADHGDAFPEDDNNAIIHNASVPEVINVKVHFHNEDVEIPSDLLNRNGEMRLCDIVRVWKSDWDSFSSDLELREDSGFDEEEVKSRLEDLGYD